MKCFPLLVEDTTDADNQMAMAGYAKSALAHLDQVETPRGIFGVCPRHTDLSFPLAFNKHIVKNRPDFRAFEPTKNAHEGTGLVPLADAQDGRKDSKDIVIDSDLVARSEVHRTYVSIMHVLGFDSKQKGSWDFMQRALPSKMLPLTKEHLLSHHFFAREYLFDRGDLEGHDFGDPVTAKCYSKLISDIDGEVAAGENNAYDRTKDVESGLAHARRKRARAVIQQGLDRWDRILGYSHVKWIDECDGISKAYMGYVTDIVIMAPCTLTMGDWTSLTSCKRVWGMFFALDNAAEYGHWVMEEKAKNIFRNNFNTALDEEGAHRMLQFIAHKEVRAYFHPTELFKGEIGAKSWEVAKVLVASAKEKINAGDMNVPPLLGIYNCYNQAKSPTAEPQQISDPMIVFEFLNFQANVLKHSVEKPDTFHSEQAAFMMPVAQYSPAKVRVDKKATQMNYEAAVTAAKAKGINESDIIRVVRREQVFVVKPSYEPLNNGTYVGMNLVNRMLPEYSKWLHEILSAHPSLSTPQERSLVLPIMDMTLFQVKTGPSCGPKLAAACWCNGTR